MLSATVEKTIQFYHLDPMSVVWHGNYVRFFEDARCVLLDKLNYNYPQMQESGYVWPVVDMRLKYVRPVRFAQRINIQATLQEYENRLKISYLIACAETGEKLTKGYTIQVAVEEKTGEMLYRSPDSFIELVESQL